jgi:hypothetical protein
MNAIHQIHLSSVQRYFAILPAFSCCLPHRDKVKKLIKRGEEMFNKEMDIVRILKTLRYVRTIRKADKQGKEAR